MARSLPNIIVTGTPGTGKTTHCEVLAEKTGLKHLSVNQVVKGRECHEGWDDEYQSWIVDEDKLLDAIEDECKAGGCMIDWHACDLFPKSWIDLVVVLRVDSAVHYDRVESEVSLEDLRLMQSLRGSPALPFLNYPEAKLQENIDSEIMEVLSQEARESYDEEIVVELQSNTPEEMETNIERIEAWLKQWKEDNADR
ncbi:hypothetical protein INS49_005179 [Diaporthe citri]|uniref:uncharacterized protein n=1 Tax=Diaporthe citri TaxID=83186 RepID=UPI001C808833|nr:uncharacterized protein INS49_005179 [Diaporthe citri]KAG6353922.1 hypothetical protein INS49_005179 [Diaporthe citri]